MHDERFGGILMKNFLKFLSVSIVLMSLASCGTEQIIVPDDDEPKSGRVIYVSPADAKADAGTSFSAASTLKK